jgi:hypothetical protein
MRTRLAIAAAGAALSAPAAAQAAPPLPFGHACVIPTTKLHAR